MLQCTTCCTIPRRLTSDGSSLLVKTRINGTSKKYSVLTPTFTNKYILSSRWTLISNFLDTFFLRVFNEVYDQKKKCWPWAGLERSFVTLVQVHCRAFIINLSIFQTCRTRTGWKFGNRPWSRAVTGHLMHQPNALSPICFGNYFHSTNLSPIQTISFQSLSQVRRMIEVPCTSNHSTSMIGGQENINIVLCS